LISKGIFYHILNLHKMKKISLLLIITFSMSIAFAQNYKKRTPEDKATYYTKQMVDDLKLDSITTTKVYEINLVVSKQLDSAFAAQTDKDAMKKVYYTVFKQRDAEFRKVLSKTQFLQYDDLQRERREAKQKEKLEKEKLENAKVESKTEG
jgi:hypothetical protein